MLSLNLFRGGNGGGGERRVEKVLLGGYVCVCVCALYVDVLTVGYTIPYSILFCLTHLKASWFLFEIGLISKRTLRICL